MNRYTPAYEELESLGFEFDIKGYRITPDSRIQQFRGKYCTEKGCLEYDDEEGDFVFRPHNTDMKTFRLLFELLGHPCTIPITDKERATVLLQEFQEWHSKTKNYVSKDAKIVGGFWYWKGKCVSSLYNLLK